MFGVGLERLRLIVVPNRHVQPESLTPERNNLRHSLSDGFGARRVVEVKRVYYKRIVSPRKGIVHGSLLWREDDGHCVAVLRRGVTREADVNLVLPPVSLNIPWDTGQTVVVLG